MGDDRKSLGIRGEGIAANYLEKMQGYKILRRNYRCTLGEMDIIAKDHDVLSFVEVKTRKSTDFGLPEESVTLSKQEQIRKIAQGFLTKNNLNETECRFDVVSLTFDKGKGYSIHHIKNAF